MESGVDIKVENEVAIACASDDSMKIEVDGHTNNDNETGNENEEQSESEKLGEHFVVGTIEEMREIVDEYCERTKSHFVVQKKSKNFGLTALQCDLSGHQVQWMDMQKKKGSDESVVQFDGIPHICVGNFYLNCQFGIDSSISKKLKRKRMREEGELGDIKHRNPKTPSKKCGCPATIVVRQIIKFPDFKIDKDTEWKRRDGASRLKMKLQECRENLLSEVLIIGRLPDESEHKFHEILEGHEFAKEIIHHSIILKAQELYLENKTNHEIRESLHQHVISEMFSKLDNVDFNRRRFFPTIKDIHNIVGRFRPLCRFTLDEEAQVKILIDKIKQCSDKFNIAFEVNDKNIYGNEQDDSSSDESVENEKEPRKKREKMVQTFLFSYQSPKQQRLMRKYCNVTYLVEIDSATTLKRSLIYRMYTLLVQTNVDFQVIGCIIISKQRKEGLIDGLKLFREWNPSWMPKYFLVDSSQVIYDAVSLVFADANYLLNPHSCESKWLEFTSAPSNSLQDHSEEVIKFLKNMQYALTEDALNVAAAFLEASEVWQTNEKLRTWFLTSWLPVAKMWVFGYRPEDLLITQHLKTSITQSIQVYQECLSLSAKTNGFVEMIENITYVISYDEYQKYVKQNNAHYMFYHNYLKTNHYSEYMQGVPLPLIPYTEGICKLAETNEFFTTCDNLGVFTVQANHNQVDHNTSENDIKTEMYPQVEVAETEFGSIEFPSKLDSGEYTVSFGDVNSHPFCTCSQWLFYRIPCVHMFAVICKIPGWKYDMLSLLYRFSPLFDIDCSCIHHPINKDLKEEGCQIDIPVVCAQTQTKTADDSIFDFPFKNVSVDVLSEQTKKAGNALFHLKSISHLFKSKVLYTKMNEQLQQFISELQKRATLLHQETGVIEDHDKLNDILKITKSINQSKHPDKSMKIKEANFSKVSNISGQKNGSVDKAVNVKLINTANVDCLQKLKDKSAESHKLTNTSEEVPLSEVTKGESNSFKIPANNSLQCGIPAENTLQCRIAAQNTLQCGIPAENIALQSVIPAKNMTLPSAFPTTDIPLQSVIPAKNIALQSGICENPVASKIIPSPKVNLKRKATSDPSTTVNCDVKEDIFNDVEEQKQREIILVRGSVTQNESTDNSRQTFVQLQTMEQSVLSVPNKNISQLSVLSILPRMIKTPKPIVANPEVLLVENKSNNTMVTHYKHHSLTSLVENNNPVIALVENKPVIPLEGNRTTISLDDTNNLKNNLMNNKIHSECNGKDVIDFSVCNIPIQSGTVCRYVNEGIENEEIDIIS